MVEFHPVLFVKYKFCLTYTYSYLNNYIDIHYDLNNINYMVNL